MIFGTDAKFPQEAQSFRESIEVGVANIFYFSGQNEWGLQSLGEKIRDEINRILPETKIDSVQIKNFKLSSTTYDQDPS